MMLKRLLLGIVVFFLLCACGGDKKSKEKRLNNISGEDVWDCGAFNEFASRDEFFKVFAQKDYLQWLDGPFVGLKKENQLVLNFQRLGDSPSRIEKICFYNYMSIHGHGGGSEPVLTKFNQNQAYISGFTFTMSGPWELEVRLQVDGRKYGLSIPVML